MPSTQLVFGARGVRVIEAGMIPSRPFIFEIGYPRRIFCGLNSTR